MNIKAENLSLDVQVFSTVTEIISSVRTQGDSALIDLTQRFDGLHVNSMEELEMPLSALKQAFDDLPDEQKVALKAAGERIRRYAERQKMESWEYTEADGTVLGQQVTALDKAGLYVRDGKAAYPLSVLMNAIPAKVAGVKELVMVVPTPNGVVNDLVLAAAHLSEVDPVRSVGDARRYEYVVALRAVKTVDFITAKFAHLPFDFLETVSRRIINEVTGISRVTYDISSKPPAMIGWE